MRIRKRIEEPFGWIKTIGGGRKLRYIGRERNRAWFKITAAVYNLIRITALDTAPPDRRGSGPARPTEQADNRRPANTAAGHPPRNPGQEPSARTFQHPA